jgi:hypothetical protein
MVHVTTEDIADVLIEDSNFEAMHVLLGLAARYLPFSMKNRLASS